MIGSGTRRRGDCLDCGTPISVKVGRCVACRHAASLPRRSLSDRFWSKVDQSGGPDACWLWTSTRDPKGYGAIYDHRVRRQVKAARVALDLDGRPVPEGMLACHHCDNPPCVNPRHLYVGTLSDNARDMYARGRFPSLHKTHCHRGHALTGDNLVIKPGRSRRCRICVNEGLRRSRQARSTRRSPDGPHVTSHPETWDRPVSIG